MFPFTIDNIQESNQGMVLKPGLPISVNAIKITPHRHSRRPISLVAMESVIVSEADCMGTHLDIPSLAKRVLFNQVAVSIVSNDSLASIYLIKDKKKGI